MFLFSNKPLFIFLGIIILRPLICKNIKIYPPIIQVCKYFYRAKKQSVSISPKSRRNLFGADHALEIRAHCACAASARVYKPLLSLERTVASQTQKRTYLLSPSPQNLPAGENRKPL